MLQLSRQHSFPSADNLNMSISRALFFLPIVLGLVRTVASAKSDQDDTLESIHRAIIYLEQLKAYAQDLTEVPDGVGAKGLEVAAECSIAINRAILAGIDDKTARILVDDYKNMTLAEVRSEYCNKLAALAENFDDRVQFAKSEQEIKLGAPFKRAGIRGDKLRLAIVAKHRGNAILGVGGAPLPPAQIRRASLLFIATAESDGQWKLYRFTFKGDKLVSETHQAYATRPNASKFR